MGNKCSCLSATGSTDEAEDALLGGSGDSREPRGPPPPYQIHHPFYMLTEEQRLHIVSRITLIQSLPVGHYEAPKVMMSEKKCEKDKTDQARECPICMNDFIPGELIRLLPCMHYYHIRCIDEWLMRAITCPTCVQRVDAAPPTHQTTRSTSHHNHRRTGSTISQGSTSSLCGSAYRRSMDVLTTPPPPPTQSPSVSPADSMQELLVEVQHHS